MVSGFLPSVVDHEDALLINLCVVLRHTTVK